MDYEPDLRLLALCPVPSKKRDDWWAVVVADNEYGWEIGRLVTVAERVSGFLLIEEG